MTRRVFTPAEQARLTAMTPTERALATRYMQADHSRSIDLAEAQIRARRNIHTANQQTPRED
jgi:hypothetical protein